MRQAALPRTSCTYCRYNGFAGQSNTANGQALRREGAAQEAIAGQGEAESRIVFGAPNFGVVTIAQDARELHFAVRFVF